MAKQILQWLKWVTTADERALDAGQPWKALGLGMVTYGVLLAAAILLVEIFSKRISLRTSSTLILICKFSAIGAVYGFYCNLVKIPEKISILKNSVRKWYVGFQKLLLEPVGFWMFYVALQFLPSMLALIYLPRIYFLQEKLLHLFPIILIVNTVWVFIESLLERRKENRRANLTRVR